MSRLFVDCDDTLVLWVDGAGDVLNGPHPYGGGADHAEPNQALIEAIARRAGEFSEVVLWSGGGARYAASWARYLPANVGDVSISTKRPHYVTADDLCVEDDNATWKFPNAQTWQEFVEGPAAEEGPQ